jgi:hypothetical protein
VADAVVGLQRAAAGLMVCEHGDLLAQRIKLGIQGVENPQRRGHRLPPGRRQARARLEPTAVLPAE